MIRRFRRLRRPVRQFLSLSVCQFLPCNVMLSMTARAPVKMKVGTPQHDIFHALWVSQSDMNDSVAQANGADELRN